MSLNSLLLPRLVGQQWGRAQPHHSKVLPGHTVL